jgi:N-acetylneuraminic acid mutarotase
MNLLRRTAPIALVSLTLSFLAPISTSAQPAMSSLFHWNQLPALPDSEGFAGTFAGVSGGALIVAGGANIVGERWSDPLEKRWYDTVFVLEKPQAQWRIGFRLPHPIGYGVSISTPDGLICIGGSDATRHFAEVFWLVWADGALQLTELPSLPRPCANACGALLGQTLYVAGGLETPTSVVALKTFWALDLSAPSPAWHELEPWPRPARMLSVAGVLDGSFYLFSGTSLSPDSDGKPVRTFLHDAYRYTPGHGWTRVTDLPRAAVAAPTPAPVFGNSELLVLTGDDGTRVNFSPLQEHPGFPRDSLAYNPTTNDWKNLGALPFSRATVPAVVWENRFVFPNGEVRPRVRTPEVWALELAK